MDTLGPGGLADACGHTNESPTVEVRLRSGDFQDSIGKYLKDFDQGTFNPLEFRYFNDANLEHSAAKRLKETPIDTTDNLVDFRNALISSHVPEDRVSQLFDGWRQWMVEGPRLGLFRRWPTRRFDLAAPIRQSSIPSEWIETGAGMKLAREIESLVLNIGDTRSASADTLFRQYTSAGETISDDVDLLRWWYHDCRQVAIARQHGAALAVRPSGHSAKLADLISDDIPINSHEAGDAESVKEVVCELGSLSRTDFMELYTGTAALRRRFTSTRKYTDLHALVSDITDRLRPQGDGKSRWFAQERIILPTATSIAGWISHGPTTAIAAGIITVGVESGARKLSNTLTDRGRTRALVRWVASDYLPEGS